MSPEAREELERAWVATRYALGARAGAELLTGLPAPGPEARRLARALTHPERLERARALAAELARVQVALATTERAWS